MTRESGYYVNALTHYVNWYARPRPLGTYLRLGSKYREALEQMQREMNALAEGEQP